jgi:SecD/SecF fusion protein
MQNRTIIWVFTILLVVACLYQISFSWVTRGVEKKALVVAQQKLDSVINEGISPVIIGKNVFDVDTDKGKEELKSYFEKEYLTEVGDAPAYPVFGFSYQDAKNNELNLGLDLQGGMSVTLEVSIPEMIDNLAGNTNKPSFRKPYQEAYNEYAKGTQEDFITIFARKFSQNDSDAKLSKFFHKTVEGIGLNDSNEQVINVLRRLSVEAVDKTQMILENRINKFGVSQPSIQKQALTGRLHIELPGVKDERRVRSLLQSTANLEFWDTYLLGEIAPNLERVNELLRKRGQIQLGNDKVEVAESLETEEQPIAEAEILQSTEGDTTKTDADSTLTDLLKSQTEADSLLAQQDNPWFSLCMVLSNDGFTPAAGYVRIKDTSKVNAILADDEIKSLLPNDLALMWGTKAQEFTTQEGVKSMMLPLYAIRKTFDGVPKIDGEGIKNAFPDYDEFGRVKVSMMMHDNAAQIWSDWTGQIAQKGFVAIAMDGYVYSAPLVQGKIPNGSTEISGNFDIKEATDLSSILRSGALPAPAKIVDEAIVGPSLGQQNISSGLTSFLIALALVLVYLIFYYTKSGFVAALALLVNIFFIVGTLASLGAALTLSGIAGIVLTIGMSVDANVLIFERVKEEMALGKTAKMALADGYKNAYSAIFDSNITTLLTAVVLAYFGSGPIQGFATTLIIGIFTSLFTAIVITRLIFSYMLERKIEMKFGTSTTLKLFTNTAIQFVEKRKLSYAVSGVIIVLGIFSLVTKGLDKGVEFTGGRTYTVEFVDKQDNQAIKTALSKVFVDESGLELAPEVKTRGGSGFVFDITTKYLAEERTTEATTKVDLALASGLEQFGAYTINQQRSVDATISSGLIYSSISAIVFSLIVIFIYIVFRFRKWQYGLGALVAMFHDVLIVLSLFSFFYGIMPFSMEIDQAFIAAILTVVGYSINDTVVVFDRIREFLNDGKKKADNGIINNALNSTLSRTINTSFTTFLVLLTIFLLGGDAIKGFTFALMIGVLVGTYSSLFIATPLVVDLSKKEKAAK